MPEISIYQKINNSVFLIKISKKHSYNDEEKVIVNREKGLQKGSMLFKTRRNISAFEGKSITEFKI